MVNEFKRAFPLKSKGAWISFSVIAYFFLLFRLAACGPLTTPITSPDSFAFAKIARLPLLSAEFYAGTKPFLLPLLYKLVGVHFPAAVFLQAIFGIVARTFLAYVVFATLRSTAAGLTATVLLLAFGCTDQVAHWDNVVLSESVTFSFLLMLLACLLLYGTGIVSHINRPSTRVTMLSTAIVLFAAGFVWIRDSNVYSILILIPILICTAVLLWKNGKKHYKSLISLTILIGFIAGLQLHLFRASHRYEFPMFNNIGHRVLKNQDMFDHFKKHGMPISSDLLAHAGKWASDDNSSMYRVEGLQLWVRKSGVATLGSYLITHPGEALHPIWGGLEFNLQRYPHFRIARLANYDPFQNTPFGDILTPSTSFIVFVPVLFLMVLGWLAWRIRDIAQGSHVVILAWFFFHAVLQLLVNYHGDAMEVERHILVSVQSFRILLWISIGFILDALLRQVRYMNRINE